MAGPYKRIKFSNDEIGETVIKGHFQFAIDCLREIKQIKQSENFVFSPSSIYEALLLVYFASKHDIEDGLKKILNLYIDVCKDDLKNYYINKKSSQGLQDEKYFDKNKKVCCQIYSDSRCWITNTKLIKNTIRENLFKHRLEMVNFSEFSHASTDYINKTLNELMASYMLNPVNFSVICNDVDLILSTILRFKDEKLQEASTSQQEPCASYQKLPKTYLTFNPNMYMTEFFHKNHSLFLLSPIAQSKSNGDWEMDNNITRLVEQLANNIDNFRSYLDDKCVKIPKEMEVTYPKYFLLEMEIPIDTLFQSLGIQTLLESNKYYLSDFTEQESLSLGNGTHRACIKTTLTEDILASAVTVFCTKNEGYFEQFDDYIHCVSKHSFLWLVYDKDSHTIISMGAINKNTT